MRRLILALGLTLALAACDNFVPADKTATYDASTNSIVPPHPCPDWSQSGTYNYLNEVHSNLGCAVNNDMSLQLADPQDLVRGHGTGPDTGISTDVVSQYRAGKLPVSLTPLQPTTNSAVQ